MADAAGANLDELYTTDGLYRLKDLQRGLLNSSNNAIVSGTLDFAQAWSLDATGNWGQFWENDAGSSWNLQQTRTANLFNEITSITGGGWAQPAYDAAGNMVSMPQPASPASSYSATYDAWNRLMSLSSGGSLVGQYAYDGVDRRARELVSGTTRHFYYSEKWQDLEERLGAATTADRQLIWGFRYIDDLVLRDRGTERMYAMQDPNWNVSGIANISGAASERYVYAAYGQPVYMNAAFSFLRSSAFNWETLFAGYRYDEESANYRIRYRDLHSRVGAWEARDKLITNGFESAGSTRFNELVRRTLLTAINPSRALERQGVATPANLYEYVDGDPTGRTDPTGLLGAFYPLPCSPAETAQCKQDCLNDITITTGKWRVTLAAYFCLKIVTSKVCITNCSCFFRTTVVSGRHDPLCKHTCPPPKIEIDRPPLSAFHKPCPGDHWHYIPYNQVPWPDCRCIPNGRLFGGCLPPGAVIW